MPSSDDSFAIAHSFAQRFPKRIRAIRLDHNVGPAEARNRAIAESSDSELIALLDADDYWLEGYLERQLATYDRACAQGRRVGIVACNALIETPDGIAGTFDQRFGWRDRIRYDDMLSRSYIMVSALFPRAAFEAVGGFFSPECWGTEDYDLWLRIMEAGYEVVTTREPLAVYRDHPGGISKNELTAADATIAAFSRALDRDAMKSSQRRRVKANLRHYRALRERALVRQAVRERSPFRVARLAVPAGFRGAVAFLQAPSRWEEWLTDLARQAGGRIAHRNQAPERRRSC